MNFGRFGKIASVSLIGAMLLAGCSGNGQTVMKIGDTNITEGAVNFFANYGMGTEDVDAAVDNLKQEYLLKEVAKAMDITLTDDEAKQVKSTISNFKAQQGGKKAGDKLLKKYGVDDDIMETIISASTYSQKIMDQLDVAEPTDDEVKQYYEEHKDTYDQVDYREFTIKAVDTTDGEMQAAKAKADEFAAGAVSEQAFNDLCKRDADDGDTKYDDINGSLFSKVVSSNMDTGTSDWLLSDDRKAGDVTVIENSSSGCYYVLYFINKSYDGSSDETIASNVLNNKYSEYISNITDSMQVDIYNRF